MTTNLPVTFLQEKIRTLQSALFVTESASLIKLPTHVVQVADMDEAGNIWFVIPKPAHLIEAFDPEIPAKLDFFKKGTGFYLKIGGTATLVNDEEEIMATGLFQHLEGQFEKQQVIAVKIKVEAADYFDPSQRPSSNWVLSAGSHIFNWLMNPLYNQRQPELITIPLYSRQ